MNEAQIEAAAKALRNRIMGTNAPKWDKIPEYFRADWRKDVITAIEAAKAASPEPL